VKSDGSEELKVKSEKFWWALHGNALSFSIFHSPFSIQFHKAIAL
jgi:hypothetical protein